VKGERIRVLFRGKLLTSALPMTWDGRDQAGRMAEAGSYYLLAHIGTTRLSAKFLFLP
jgi:hypothetical protein